MYMILGVLTLSLSPSKDLMWSINAYTVCKHDSNKITSTSSALESKACTKPYMQLTSLVARPWECKVGHEGRKHRGKVRLDPSGLGRIWVTGIIHFTTSYIIG